MGIRIMNQESGIMNHDSIFKTHKNMQKIKNIRKPFAAGKFYPSEKDVLKREVNYYLAESKNKNSEKDEIFALMVPHAGYQYAGDVFGSAYKTVQGRKINTIIIIANSHKKYFDGISIYNKGAYEIPFGNILIDEEMADAIIGKNNYIIFDEDAHLGEHSIEVQLPFLKVALGDFKIAPIIMGNDLMSSCKILAKAIGDVIGDRKDILIVASSDMSHYPPYEIANKVDKEVLDMIKKGDAGDLEALLMELELKRFPNAITFLCGAGAVKTLMILSQEKGARRIEVLKYSNSGDNAGKDEVVGYGAVSFSFGGTQENFLDEGLSKDDREILLKIVKDAVEAEVRGASQKEIKNLSEFLKSKRGAFVTLRMNGELRGCIGVFVSDEPLYEVARDMAVQAASADPRFIPVGMNELADLEYEISALSPLEKVSDPYNDIEIGKHGVKVKQGFRSGVFLPQVAVEEGWDLEKFMGELCEHKAGIPRNAWKDGSAEIYRFTAEIIK